MDEIIEQIHREMLLELSNNFDKSRGSFAYDILKPPASVLYDLDQKIDKADDKRDIFNLEGEELDRFISQFTPVSRNKSTYAVSNRVRITGKPGTFVSDGILVGSTSHTYTVVEGGRLDKDGIGYFTVRCTSKGKKGNADIGVINKFPVTISGLETIYNETPAIDGFDEEDDESLINKFFNYINLPATSGNIYHYMLWATEIDGVGTAMIYPLWNGDNTVKIVLIDSNGNPASDKLVKQAQDYIDPMGKKLPDGTYELWGRGAGEAPIGAFCTVVSATPISIKIEADIIKDPEADMVLIEKEFKQRLLDGFSNIALTEGINTVSAAKIGCALLDVNGVLDYDNASLKINGQQGSVALKEEEVPVFDEVILNEI